MSSTHKTRVERSELAASPEESDLSGLRSPLSALDGMPVLTADGDTIEDTDETTGGDPATDDQGNPVQDEKGNPVMNPITFVKAPEIAIDPAKHEWREHFVEEQTVLYQGLDIAACHWRDVHWPINAPSLEKADFVSHTFDLRWSALRAKYAPGSFAKAEGRRTKAEGDKTSDEAFPDDAGDSDLSDLSDLSELSELSDPSDTPKAAAADDQEVMEILNSIRASSRGPKSHESRPRPGEAEVLGGEVDDPIIKVCEVSYDYDCFEDGIVRRLWLVILPDFDQCLYADFRANVSPRAAKPIHLVTVNQVKHRAYGKGLHETYEKMANVADGLLCSILYKNKINSDPTKIWNPDRTNEGAANPTLVIEPGRTYSIKGSQWGPKDILACVEIPDLDDRTWKLMELFMQLIQVDSGVTNANQGDMTDLPSNTTATGVNSMLESSSVLHQYILEELRDCLTPHLGYAIELIYMKQDRNETFDYLEQDEAGASPGSDGKWKMENGKASGAAEGPTGQTGQTSPRALSVRKPASLHPAALARADSQPPTSPTPAQRTVEAIMELRDAKKLAGLAMKVEFLITRAKRQEQREAAMAAIPIGVQYGTLGPKDQTRLRDCFVQLFRALGFDRPEDFFPVPDLNTPPPAPPPPPPPRAVEAIALKGADLTPSQKDALAQQFGLPAATPQELQQATPDNGGGAGAQPAQGSAAGSPAATLRPPSPAPTTPAPNDATDDPSTISNRTPFVDPSDANAPQPMSPTPLPQSL